MTPRERFLATLERGPVDRPAWWLGAPTPGAEQALRSYYGAPDRGALKRLLADDVWELDIPFAKPPANHLACAFDWVRSGYHERTLTAPGFFAGCEDPGRTSDFDWPDPVRHMDAARIRAACAEAPPDRARLALLWSCHLQDLWAAFGMEDALVAMVERPAVAQAVLARILDFYLKANRLVYEAAGRFLDAVLIGNDIGCQTGLMLAPELVRRYMLPGTKALIEQAHSYGIKVLHHSCGSIRPLIPDLVSAGADALHPIQALAAGMAAEELAGEFRDRVSFVGGLDVQELMVHGAPEAVERRVRELAALFPTGLVISPSHEALLPDVPPENVEAFRRAMRRLGPDR